MWTALYSGHFPIRPNDFCYERNLSKLECIYKSELYSCRNCILDFFMFDFPWTELYMQICAKQIVLSTQYTMSRSKLITVNREFFLVMKKTCESVYVIVCISLHYGLVRSMKFFRQRAWCTSERKNSYSQNFSFAIFSFTDNLDNIPSLIFRSSATKYWLSLSLLIFVIKQAQIREKVFS